jgi:hypothetical protein
MSSGSLDSEGLKDAAVPLKPALQTGRHVHILLNFVDRGYGLSQEHSAPELKETVIAGNCPWWLIESARWSSQSAEGAEGHRVRSWRNWSSRGAGAVAGRRGRWREALEAGGARVVADGVYCAEVVSAFEPADGCEPEEAKGRRSAGAACARRRVGLNVDMVELVRVVLESAGRLSRITWYWFTCVYIVLICRWPKAS